MRPLPRIAIAGSLLAAVLSLKPAAAGPFDGCEGPDAPVTVGAVACRTISAGDTLGGATAFSYYVPSACTTEARCPTLYLLHGFGGDYTTMLGPTGHTQSAWLRALTTGPDDPEGSLTPWDLTWTPKARLDLVLVAPHGRTLANPGAFGSAADVDTFYADWNPRFALDGNAEAYETPAPRWETFFVRSLIPFVEARFPVGPGRDWRAIDGVSLGGYGAFKVGLQHPDLFASIGAVSGSHNILVAPSPDPIHVASPVEAAPPVAAPYTPLPSFGSRLPITAFPGPSKGFAAAFFVFGDPTFDQAWFRGNQPRDLAMNARAFAGAAPSVRLISLNNDAVPRRLQDFGPAYPVTQGFEALVLDMNAQMQVALIDQGVPDEARKHAINPGLHDGVYWDPFVRGRLEEHAALLAPGGSPPPPPATFDFRSIATDFTVWGYRFTVERTAVEFLNVRDVSCAGATVQGTGIVTVTPPPSCGAQAATADLGHEFPADEQAGASAVPAYGATRRVTFGA